jgi:hypothetical protein
MGFEGRNAAFNQPMRLGAWAVFCRLGYSVGPPTVGGAWITATSGHQRVSE